MGSAPRGGPGAATPAPVGLEKGEFGDFCHSLTPLELSLVKDSEQPHGAIAQK